MKILSKIPYLLAFWVCFFFSAFLFAQEQGILFDIQGVDKEIEENIRANLSTLQEFAEIAIEPDNMAQIEQRARQEIALAVQPYGYYSPEIKILTSQNESKWKITFQIQLGPPTIIENLHFILAGEGENNPELNSLRQNFPLQKGNTFVHELYEEGKKAALSKVLQNGYVNAVFSEHRVEVNVQTHTCEIFLTLETGQRFYFGPVTFETTLLSNELLYRYLPFEPGEPYSPDKVLTLQSHLSQSDYFSQVNVKPVPNEDMLAVPIEVELEDAKPNQYLIGAGFGTDTGIRGKLGWTRRRLNSYGHRFSAQAQAAEIYNKIQLDYSIPGKHPHTDQIKLKAGFFEDEFSEKPSTIYETGITEEREIFGWQRKISLNYHHEKFGAFITNDTVQSKLILPSITFIQTKRDDATNPTRGRRIEITMRGSIDALFSDTTFFQSYLQLRWLHAFNDKTKLLTRTEFGFTLPDDSEKLPLSQRFFAGGDLSLRGYGYRSLPSEIDKEGNRQPVGGAYLGIASIELVRTIKKPVGIFVFTDAGNAFRRSFFDEIEVGSGVGIEWQTRLGPIKFAVAKPLTKSSDAWRIHASFGPEL